MQKLAPSPSQPQCHLVPYGLVSLWDMIKIAMRKYLDLGISVRDAQAYLDAADGVELPAEEAKFATFEAISEMADLSAEIEARQSERYLRARIDHKTNEEWEFLRPKSWEEIDRIVDVFKNELDERLFLYIPTADAAYYECNTILSDRTRAAFPMLAQELRSAGNAYACGLPTASVFHCMRALEFALSALAKDVGLVWEKEQWHVIIQKIEARIDKERNTLPRGTPKDERLKFLSEVAREFYYFKDGWRNYVAHNKINYDAPQAMEVMTHVRTFVEKLATELTEQ